MASDFLAFRKRLWTIVGVCFLAGASAELLWEVWTAQREADALGRILSREMAAAPDQNPEGQERFEKILARYRENMALKRAALFDNEGRKLAEFPREAHEGSGIHGVLLSARAGLRDAATGQENSHLVLWKDMTAGVARSALLGLVAGLAGALLFWAFGRRREGEQGAEGTPASG